VVRAVCDLALRALSGRGRLMIADAPLQSCDFETVCQLSGIEAVRSHYLRAGTPVEVADLRLARAVARREGWFGRVLVRERLAGDPEGYTVVDLGATSLHAERGGEGRFRVTGYDSRTMERHHGGGRHEYVIANSLLRADVVINVPKMKTHHKAGITGALKNFVGICGHKDCLPHHLQGAAESGGDEYPRKSALKRLDARLLDYQESFAPAATRKALAAAHRLLRTVHMREADNGYWEGGWHGNDTISRTTVDLNRIVRYADASGQLAQRSRTTLTVVDGVIAGEEDGPLAPRPKPAGLILAGENPVAVDLVLARIMGFRWQAIPTLRHASDGAARWPLLTGSPADVVTVSDDSRWAGIGPDSPGDSLAFEAHPGWKDHVEGPWRGAVR
jgi:hypothetical protein